MNLASLLRLGLFKQSFWEFWAARNARERLMLTTATAVVMLSLIYALLIAPAVTGRAQANKNLPLLRQQVAQMQALAKEAATLAALPVLPAPALSREFIAASLTRKGLQAQSVMLSGAQIEVQLSSASFAATLAWLDEMQRSARLAVVEANFVALDLPDMVNAKLTLRQPGNDQAGNE